MTLCSPPPCTGPFIFISTISLMSTAFPIISHPEHHSQLPRTKLIHITTANWSLLQHCVRKSNLLKLLYYYYCHYCRKIRLSFECLPEVLVQAFALMLTLTAAESDLVTAFAPLQVIIATKREGEREIWIKERESFG